MITGSDTKNFGETERRQRNVAFNHFLEEATGQYLNSNPDHECTATTKHMTKQNTHYSFNLGTAAIREL